MTLHVYVILSPTALRPGGVLPPSTTPMEAKQHPSVPEPNPKTQPHKRWGSFGSLDDTNGMDDVATPCPDTLLSTNPPRAVQPLSPLSLALAVNGEGTSAQRGVTPKRRQIRSCPITAVHVGRTPTPGGSAPQRRDLGVSPMGGGTVTAPPTRCPATEGVLFAIRDAAHRCRVALVAAGAFHALNLVAEFLPAHLSRKVIALAKILTCMWFLQEMRKSPNLTSSEAMSSHHNACLSPSPLSSRSQVPTPSGQSRSPTPVSRPLSRFGSYPAMGMTFGRIR